MIRSGAYGSIVSGNKTYLIEMHDLRMEGHEEASGVKYVQGVV